MPFEVIVKIGPQYQHENLQKYVKENLNDENASIEKIFNHNTKTPVGQCGNILNQYYKVKSKNLKSLNELENLPIFSFTEPNYILTTKEDPISHLAKLEMFIKERNADEALSYYWQIHPQLKDFEGIEKLIPNLLKILLKKRKYLDILTVIKNHIDQSYGKSIILEVQTKSWWELGHTSEITKLHEHVLNFKKTHKKRYRPHSFVSFVNQFQKFIKQEESLALRVRTYFSENNFKKAFQKISEIKTPRLIKEILNEKGNNFSLWSELYQIKRLLHLTKAAKKEINIKQALIHTKEILSHFSESKSRDAGEILTIGYHLAQLQPDRHSDLLLKIKDIILAKHRRTSLAKSFIKAQNEAEKRRELLAQKMLAKERAEALAREESIENINDPLSSFLWGLHSEFSIKRIEKKYPYTATTYSDYDISLVKRPISEENRFDIFLREGLNHIKTRNKKLSTSVKETMVAVIDTGVDYTHPDLQSVIAINQEELSGQPGVDDDGNGYIDDIYGANFVNNKSHDPMDDRNHGTHVAGTIAAAFNGLGVSGINPWAKILPVKVLNSSGEGKLSDILRGLVYAHQRGAKVMNLSLGGSSFSKSASEVYNCLANEGALVVAAAGNRNSDESSYPSDYDHVLSVAAHNFEGQKTYFSNYSSNVDISAPGLKILSTVPRHSRVEDDVILDHSDIKETLLAKEKNTTDNYPMYASMNGTSMATPHVAGVASLIYSTFPNISRDEVVSRLLLGAKPHIDHRSEFQNKQGKGYLNLKASLEANPEVFFHPLGTSEIIYHNHSRQDPTTYILHSHIKLKNYGLKKGVVAVTANIINNEENTFQINFPQNSFEIPSGSVASIPFEFKILSNISQSQDVDLEITYQSEDHIFKDYTTIRINYFHQLYKDSSSFFPRPSTSNWLPQGLPWGEINKLQKDGSIFSLSKGSVIQKGKSYSRWMFNSINPKTGFISSSRSYLTNGHIYERVHQVNGDQFLAYTSFLQNLKGEYQTRNSGFTLFNAKGDILNHQHFSPRSETLKMFNTKTSSTIALFEKSIDIDRKKYSYDLNKFIIYSLNKSFKEDWRYEFIAGKRKATFSVCDINNDQEDEILVFSQYSDKNLKTKYAHKSYNSSSIRILNLKGKLIYQKNFPGLLFQSPLCQKINNRGTLLFFEKDVIDSLNYHVNSYVFNKGELEKRWSYKITSFSFASKIQVLRWVDYKDVIIFHSSYNQLSIINDDGRDLTGWPVHVKNFSQGYGLHKAIITRGEKPRIIILEPHGHIHSFDLEGNIRKTLKLPGNYNDLPVYIPEQSSGYLIFTSNIGVQKVELSFL